MAAPTFVRRSTGSTDAGGAWSHTSSAPDAAGQLLLVHLLQDGTADNTVTITSVTNAEDLAGTDNVLTYVGAFDVGASQEAIQHIWLGRSLSTSAMVITGANSGTDDLYVWVQEYTNVSTGTTLGTVIENGSAGGTANSTGTSATLSDAAVTTLGVDRLALCLQAANDNVSILSLTGETGGTWISTDLYSTATGTDGAIARSHAAMATAGTIDGGTASLGISVAWGAVGFALIGTTVEAVDRHGGMVSPTFVNQAVPRASSW